MKAIVAVDKNWGIGRAGQLLLRVPADMKRFREITTGGVVVLGRKTMQTFPQGRPLPQRTNVVFSRNENLVIREAIMVRDTAQLDAFLKNSGAEEERVFVIGGEQIYRLLLPRCDTCYVTFFDRVFDADAHFPDLDRDAEWALTEESEEQVYFDTTYTFRTYRRKP